MIHQPPSSLSKSLSLPLSPSLSLSLPLSLCSYMFHLSFASSFTLILNTSRWLLTGSEDKLRATDKYFSEFVCIVLTGTIHYHTYVAAQMCVCVCVCVCLCCINMRWRHHGFISCTYYDCAFVRLLIKPVVKTSVARRLQVRTHTHTHTYACTHAHSHIQLSSPCQWLPSLSSFLSTTSSMISMESTLASAWLSCWQSTCFWCGLETGRMEPRPEAHKQQVDL